VGSWQVVLGLTAAVPDLLPQLQASAAAVSARLGQFDVEVVDVGFISDAIDAGRAAERLEAAGCDSSFVFLRRI